MNDLYDTRTLRDLGFNVFDTKISGALDVSMVKHTDLQTFMDTNPERAKLVFTSEDRK